MAVRLSEPIAIKRNAPFGKQPRSGHSQLVVLNAAISSPWRLTQLLHSNITKYLKSLLVFPCFPLFYIISLEQDPPTPFGFRQPRRYEDRPLPEITFGMCGSTPVFPGPFSLRVCPLQRCPLRPLTAVPLRVDWYAAGPSILAQLETRVSDLGRIS
jgi:hypothetical protein